MYQKAKLFALNQPQFRKIIGMTLVFLGFIALITPLTPGATLMLVGGLELLGIRFLFTDRLLGRGKGE